MPTLGNYTFPLIVNKEDKCQRYGEAVASMQNCSKFLYSSELKIQGVILSFDVFIQMSKHSNYSLTKWKICEESIQNGETYSARARGVFGQ